MKYSVISSFLSKTKDRFHEYNEQLTLEKKFQKASEIEGIGAMECVFPYEVNDPKETLALMKKYNLDISAVNVNVKVEPEFRMGGLTSKDPKIRERAVQFIKDGKDFAADIGVNKITICPLGDGYEFSFQANYKDNWNRLITTFKEAGNYRPEITMFIEYKPSETRGKCFLDNASKTALLIKEIGLKNIGVTIDEGHSLYGKNNPAEELSLLDSLDIPYYIHINDNDALWDWDYFCSSKHPIEHLEFLYYIKKFGYKDWITSDTSPTRWNIKKVFEANTKISKDFEQILDKMEEDGFEEILKSDEYMDIWEFVRVHLFK
jgi:xylose isomerase